MPKTGKKLLVTISGLLGVSAGLIGGEISGTLSADTTLTSDKNPWLVSQDLIIPDNIILTINAGVETYFDKGVGIIVQEGGTLHAEGSESNRILMTRSPENTDNWDGIEFHNSLEANVLSYIDMEYGDGRSNWISIDTSKVNLNAVQWQTTDKTILEINHPSLLVKDCIFPDVGSAETIHGEYLTEVEYLILDGNTFGVTLGYNDVIDFTDCKRPGPILEAYNNVFLGGSDDGLDLDGTDAHIEGNIFQNFHKGHDGTSTSNAIATGLRNDKTSDIVVVRNLFIDCDHAILLKEDCYMTSENNTYVNCTQSVVNFSEHPDRDTDPGKGASFIADIFWNNAGTFQNTTAQAGNVDPEIIVNRCLIPDSLHHLGDNNHYFDPLFIDSGADFHLQTTSPAIRLGVNGLDLGCYIPAGISISGEPDSSTTETTANLNIWGPGITEYRYNLTGESDIWSRVLSIADNPTLILTGLETGQSYTVYMIGKNSAGRWQERPTVSKSWRILSSPDYLLSSDQRIAAVSRLFPNYPNPFNANTTFGFYIAEDGQVRIAIHDLLGRKVLDIFDGYLHTGNYQHQWNGRAAAGNPVPSGTYFIRITSDSFQLSRKIVILR